MRSSKISLIIPHLDVPGAKEALRSCLESFNKSRVKDVELIIIVDVLGYGAAVNQGLSQATGEWMFVVNNDTEILFGKLEMMLLPENIAVPQITPPPRDNNPRCFFSMPRKIYEEVKNFYSDDFYDERFFPGYFEDDDLIRRLELLGRETIVVDSVVVYHKDGGGLTMKQMGEQESFEENKMRFEEKWGLTGFTV